MKRTALGALLLLALAAGACTRSIQPEDDSDPAIKARVETALRGRTDVEIRFVTIDVVNGLVTVSGVVPEPSQIRLIQRIVQRVPGVDQVMNNVVAQE